MYAGHIRVWGGDLDEVQRCEVDSRGNLCGGPVVSDQDEIEEQIARGYRGGETAAGHRWEYADYTQIPWETA